MISWLLSRGSPSRRCCSNGGGHWPSSVPSARPSRRLPSNAHSVPTRGPDDAAANAPSVGPEVDHLLGLATLSRHEHGGEPGDRGTQEREHETAGHRRGPAEK